MKGLVGYIPGKIHEGDLQKFIVAQSADAWTYYSSYCFWNKKLMDFDPSHQKIAKWNGLRVEPSKSTTSRIDGIVDEINFFTGPHQFEGVMGGGFAKLKTEKKGLVLLLYDSSLSYGPINEQVFLELKNQLLEAYLKVNPNIVEVEYSPKILQKTR